MLCLAPLRYRRLDRLTAYATIFYSASFLGSRSEQTLKWGFPEWNMAEALWGLETVRWLRFGAGKPVRALSPSSPGAEGDPLVSRRVRLPTYSVSDAEGRTVVQPDGPRVAVISEIVSHEDYRR